jgi:hypothetical protein
LVEVVGGSDACDVDLEEACLLVRNGDFDRGLPSDIHLNRLDSAVRDAAYLDD